MRVARRAGRAGPLQGRRAMAVARAAAGADGVGAKEGLAKLQRQGYKFLDLRDEKAYDWEHLTKPPRTNVNVPFGGDVEAFLERMGKVKGVPKSQPLLVACKDGTVAPQAAAALTEAGWTQVELVAGGYNGWREVLTTSGRPMPPKGRWVSTGKEALKSGLNVGDAAAAYEEQLNVEDLTSSDKQVSGDFAQKHNLDA